MLQMLPTALAQIKVGTTSENLQNTIWKMVYSLYHVREITRKVYNNTINSIKV